MGNVFMPSVASSLNQASGDSLLQILQQRALEQEMQKQLFSQQRQGQQDMLSTGMKLRAADLADRKHSDALKAAELKSAADAKKAAEESRGRLNTTNAAGMVFDRLAMDPTDRSPGLLRAAHEGKVGVSMLPKEPAAPKETPAERHARIVADGVSRAEGESLGEKKFPKPTKVAKGPKDDAGLPSGFRQAIENRKGKVAGFATREEAFESIRGKWEQWRRDYPGLDASKVKSELENIYGPKEPVAAGGGFIMTAAEMAEFARRKAAEAQGVQR